MAQVYLSAGVASALGLPGAGIYDWNSSEGRYVAVQQSTGDTYQITETPTQPTTSEYVRVSTGRGVVDVSPAVAQKLAGEKIEAGTQLQVEVKPTGRAIVLKEGRAIREIEEPSVRDEIIRERAAAKVEAPIIAPPKEEQLNPLEKLKRSVSGILARRDEGAAAIAARQTVISDSGEVKGFTMPGFLVSKEVYVPSEIAGSKFPTLSSIKAGGELRTTGILSGLLQLGVYAAAGVTESISFPKISTATTKVARTGEVIVKERGGVAETKGLFDVVAKTERGTFKGQINTATRTFLDKMQKTSGEFDVLLQKVLKKGEKPEALAVRLNLESIGSTNKALGYVKPTQIVRYTERSKLAQFFGLDKIKLKKLSTKDTGLAFEAITKQEGESATVFSRILKPKGKVKIHQDRGNLKGFLGEFTEQRFGFEKLKREIQAILPDSKGSISYYRSVGVTGEKSKPLFSVTDIKTVFKKQKTPSKNIIGEIYGQTSQQAGKGTQTVSQTTQLRTTISPSTIKEVLSNVFKREAEQTKIISAAKTKVPITAFAATSTRGIFAPPPQTRYPGDVGVEVQRISPSAVSTTGAYTQVITTKIGTGVVQKPKIKVDIKTKQTTDVINKQDLGLKNIVSTTTTPVIDTAQLQNIAQSTAQAQKTATRTVTKTGGTGTPYTGFGVPAFGIPFVPIIPVVKPEFKLEEKTKKKKKKKKKKGKRAYAPTLTAIELGIKGKRPKRITGVGVRPVTKVKRPRRVKLKI